MVEAAPVSQQKRKRIEEPFGWGKTIGGLAGPMLRGVKKPGFKFTLHNGQLQSDPPAKAHRGHSMTRQSNTRYFGEPSMMRQDPRPAGSDLRNAKFE